MWHRTNQKGERKMEKYEVLEIEIIVFGDDDVIVASNPEAPEQPVPES